MGRGFLSGKITGRDRLAADDFRRSSPRCAGQNFDRNLDVVRRVQQPTQTKGITPAQLALAWARAQGDDMVPIPGTKHPPSRRTWRPLT